MSFMNYKTFWFHGLDEDMKKINEQIIIRTVSDNREYFTKIFNKSIESLLKKLNVTYYLDPNNFDDLVQIYKDIQYFNCKYSISNDCNLDEEYKLNIKIFWESHYKRCDYNSYCMKAELYAQYLKNNYYKLVWNGNTYAKNEYKEYAFSFNEFLELINISPNSYQLTGNGWVGPAEDPQGHHFNGKENRSLTPEEYKNHIKFSIYNPQNKKYSSWPDKIIMW